MSFIYRDEALGKGKSGRPTIVPGRAEASELIARITSTDPEVRMPYHAPPLSDRQIQLLKQWINEGAKWEEHWAFVRPKPQGVPRVERRGWARNPIDNFILARLEKEKLAPSPEADKRALLRRLSFDLTGLPPSPEELDAFLADTSPDAYARQVDRLLASPHYGERWASLWLDLARYADSKGYDQDVPRANWPYREWVVNAFNRNLPYDQFVITQLAGDLLPHATFEDRIATAFNRQSPDNDEMGSDDEEYRTLAVMDRVATTWSVVNGVTMNCVQCHAHPYDPIRHEEYYKFLAFFNTSEDASTPQDDQPVLHVPEKREFYDKAFMLRQQIASLSEAVVGAGRAVQSNAAQWRALPISKAFTSKTLGMERQLALFQRQGPLVLAEVTKASRTYVGAPALKGFIADTKGEIARSRKTEVPEPFNLKNGEAWARGENVSHAAVSEFIATSDVPVLTALRVEVLPFAPKIARQNPEQGFNIERIEAWIVSPNGKERPIAFRTFAPDRNVQLNSQLALVGANSNATAPGTPALAEQAASGALQATRLSNTRWIVGVPTEPINLPPHSRIKLRLTQTNDMALLAFFSTKAPVARRVRLTASSDPRWTAFGADTKRADQIARIRQLYRQLAEIPTVPVPVMAEQRADERRPTLTFERGNFLAKTGPELSPDVPALFPKLPQNSPRNRLTMARWFFSSEQPLTARVAVNRFWEQLFGVGLVETLEDFGSVGEKPSHPELLDWLALHFQNDLKWDMKALLRELVLSATYRQTAAVTAPLLKKDPRNRLLARGPRQRLTAEMVRDQALAASGLLNTALGGPPVMPPLPPGVETTFGVYFATKWIDATGPDRYRRALYTYFQRSNAYPGLTTFDASDRQLSLARRVPTNTPLQALLTLNDILQHECSVALAKRLMNETPPDLAPGQDRLAARLQYGARLVLSRELTPVEMTTVRALYETALEDRFAKSPKVMTASAVAGGVDHAPKSGKLAAYTAVASALFNLDAALTR